PPLPVEERQVGSGPGAGRRGRAGVLGDPRLPQPWGSVAGTAVRGRLTWLAARVVEVIVETPRVRSLVLDVEGWPGHRPGQHVDIRLTAPDGYQAQRSYSIASPPEQRFLTLTVEQVADGEVSPYLVDEVRAADVIELRGPIGGWFVWEPAPGGPVLMVAGGSGI